jgi:hypothetical protein
MKKQFLSLALVFSTVSVYAQAHDWSLISKLTLVEATHMPNTLVFKLKSPPPASANCVTDGGGTWIIYEAYYQADTSGKQQNIKAAYALALTAKATDANVIVAGWKKGVKNGDHCTVGSLYLE